MRQDKKSNFDNYCVSRLKEIREQRGLSQTQFAQLIGVTQNTFSDWENNKSKPTLSAIIAASYRFSINEQWLRYGIGDKKAGGTGPVTGAVVSAESFEHYPESAASVVTSNYDSELERIIDAWPALSGHQKDAIISVLDAFSKQMSNSLVIKESKG